MTSEFPVLTPRDVWEVEDEGGPKLDMSKPFVVKSCQEKIGDKLAKLDGFAESVDKFKTSWADSKQRLPGGSGRGTRTVIVEEATKQAVIQVVHLNT